MLAYTVSPNTDDEYLIQFSDTDYESDTSSSPFPYKLCNTNPAKLLQIVKNMKNIHHKAIILLNIYRILMYQESNSQQKNLTLQDHPNFQYEGHPQVTMIQTFWDKTMPKLPKDHSFQDHLQIIL